MLYEVITGMLWLPLSPLALMGCQALFTFRNNFV